MKILKKALIALITLILIFFIGGSIFVGKLVNDGIFYQNEGKDTHLNSIKQLEKWGYDASEFLAKYQGIDFVVETKDVEQICGTSITKEIKETIKVPGTYYLCDTPSDNYVIIVHGAGGDRISVLPVAEILLKNNYNVITYDQRGHGENSDPRVGFGILEKQDVASLVDYAKNTLNADKVVVLGQSMGGMTTALYSATQHAKDNVDAIILDSPIPSMTGMLFNMFTEDGTPDEVANYIINCGSIYCRFFSNFIFSKGETSDIMKNNYCKTLVILSEKDDICLPSDVTSLYENIASNEKEIVRFDCKHIEGAIDYPESYEKAIINFLNK